MVSKDSFKGRSNEYTWLCSIAKNLCYDLFREEGKKANLSEVGEVAAEGKSYEEDFIQKEKSFMIHKVLHDMDEPYKEVFSLRVFGELSFKEIGALFDKSENWACVTYHRSRKKIQEALEGKE